jgi:hypothetical protein
MHTGENEQGLRKILDMTRLISIVILGIHFYYYCYKAFQSWELTAQVTDRILGNMLWYWPVQQLSQNQSLFHWGFLLFHCWERKAGKTKK